MDANKAKKLREIGYQIPLTCGICVNGNITPGTDWGTCGKFTYDHIKHTGVDHPLSINRYGSCPQGSISDVKTGQMHGFKEFIAGPSK